MPAPFRLLIDPGHGGTDPGCVHHGIEEKSITLALGLMLRDVCTTLGISVDMTRVQDVTLPLHARLGNGTYDLVLCLHVDASNDPAVGGLDAYVKADDSRIIGTGRAIVQCAPGPLRREKPRLITCTPGDWTHRAYNCLKGHTSPAVLVECGFLSNKRQAAYLTDSAGRWGITACLLHAISTARYGGQGNVYV